MGYFRLCVCLDLIVCVGVLARTVVGVLQLTRRSFCIAMALLTLDLGCFRLRSLEGLATGS